MDAALRGQEGRRKRGVDRGVETAPVIRWLTKDLAWNNDVHILTACALSVQLFDAAQLFIGFPPGLLRSCLDRFTDECSSWPGWKMRGKCERESQIGQKGDFTRCVIVIQSLANWRRYKVSSKKKLSQAAEK
ncbi:hypothetical protein K0M31_014046 [Melipona bicolor]|uniref:Uncharacterized protein n=1 Tax=Melipona bicolor TaxID=60889 RepID=A0AA40KTX1_9HYME|nr:hypothetical protein K0M31_014046 [Melipona bicolor]